MASLSISSIADVFPATTSVGAYPATGWSQAALPPSGAPPVSATASGTVASDGSLAISGLANGTPYYLAASVSGTWRYRRARTDDASTLTGNGVIVDAYRDYGVRADGTDQATHLQNFLNALRDEGPGGRGILPAGTIVTSGTLDFDSRVDFGGVGLGATVIKLADSSNVPLLRSRSFDSLTGGSTDGGPTHFAIRNLMLDGNKANNASGGRLLEIYGYEFLLENLLLRNGASDGMYLEFGGPNSADDADALFDEATVQNCKVFSCNGHGVWFNGVHDSTFTNVVSALNGSGAGGLQSNFRLEGKGGNWIGCHAWGSNCDYAWHIRGAEHLVEPQGEGALVAQFFIEWHDAHLVAPRAFWPIGASNTAFKLGDGSHTPQRTIIDGFHAYKTAGGVQSFNPVVDFTHAGVQTVVRGTIDMPAGAAYTGTIPSDADVDLTIGGGTTQASIVQRPGGSNSPTDPQTLRNGGTVYRETIPRQLAGSSSGITLTTAIPVGVGIPLQKGDVVAALTFVCRNQALVLGTSPHCWAALLDPSGNVLSQSTDDTAATFSTGPKTFTLAAAQTIATPGLYYAVFHISQTGGTLPNLAGVTNTPSNLHGALIGAMKKLAWTAPSNGTGTAANVTIGSATTSNNIPYCVAS